MTALLGAFTDGIMNELSDDMEDVLEGLGAGIADFFYYLEDVNPDIVPMLSLIGPGIAELLMAMGSEGLADFDTDLEDVFEELGAGIGEFLWYVGDMDADQIEAMSGVGHAISGILSGLGSIGEIEFDPDDLSEAMEDLGPGILALLDPLKEVDDEVLEAASSVGGVLAALFSSLGTVGNPEVDWGDVFEGFGEGLEEMFDEIGSLDKDDMKMAVTVGGVLAELFGAFEGFTLTEQLGDAIGNLGDGIEDFFDEVEHVDEASMEIIPAVARAMSRLFRDMPLDVIATIDAENIGEQLEELGWGIHEMIDDEMVPTDFEDELPLMPSVGLAIKQVVIPLIETDMESIPKDIGGILENLGEGIYDLFDEMSDLGGEEDTLALMGGMGSFGQLLSGVAAISDTGVDIGALTKVSQSMRHIIGTIGEIFKDIEDEENAALAAGVTSVSSGPTQSAIDALIARMTAMGQGARALMDGFGDVEHLKELATLDVGGLLGGMTNAISKMLELMDTQTLGKEFESEEAETDFFTHLAVRMSLLGKGIKSIIGAFSDIELLTALDDIDLDGILDAMSSGIEGMMKLVDPQYYVGAGSAEFEGNTTDWIGEIAIRMESLGRGMKSIIDAFSDIDTLSALGEMDLDDIMWDMQYGIGKMMDLVDVSSWWSDESEEDATKRFDEMSKRMKLLGDGVGSIIDAFSDVDTLTALNDIDLDDIMWDMQYGIGKMMDLVDVSSWWSDESEEDATKRFDEMSKRMKSLGEGVGSIIGAFSDIDTLTALNDIDLDDIMEDMQYGIGKMMDLVDVSWWWSDESEEDATKRFDEMSKRMKSLGEGVGSIIDAFSDIDTLSALGDMDLDDIMSDMRYGIKSLMRLVDGDVWFVGNWTEEGETDYYAQVAERMKSLGEGVGSIIDAFSDIDTLSALGEMDFDGIMNDMRWGIRSLMRLTEWGWYVGDEEEETDYYAQMAERMKSLGEGVGSIIDAFSDIDTLSGLDGLDLEDMSESMMDGMHEMMDEIQDVDMAAIPIIYEVAPAIKAMVGSVEGLGALSGVDVEDVMGDMADGFMLLRLVVDDFDEETIAKFTRLGEAMSMMSMSGMNITPVLEGLKSIASQEFADGLARATSAIYDFAHALMAMRQAAGGETPGTPGEVDEGGGASPTGNVAEGIPVAEQLTGGTAELDQLAEAGLGASAPAESGPVVVETVASVGATGGSADMSSVEAKLTELIGLMKSGGIAVNLDGKKVHKGLASSIESSPLV
jgi:hypothetical protein